MISLRNESNVSAIFLCYYESITQIWRESTVCKIELELILECIKWEYIIYCI